MTKTNHNSVDGASTNSGLLVKEIFFFMVNSQPNYIT